MSFTGTIKEADADGRLAELYASERSSKGYVPNYLAAFSYRPDVYDAWANLIVTIRGNMDLRRYELATFAAARELRSSYCSLAHAKVLRDKFVDEEGLRKLMIGLSPDPIDQLVMELAAKAATDATSVTAADVEGLRRAGLGEEEILDVILAAAARSFFTKVIDATGTSPDLEYRDEFGDDLAEALAIGRPIESEWD